MSAVRKAFARIGSFTQSQLIRQLDQLEQNLITKFQQDDLNAFGPMRVTPLKTAAYQASFWDVIRCDPSAAGFTIWIPSPLVASSGWIWVYNDTTSANTIRVRCVDPLATIGRAGSATIAVANGVMRLVPDPFSNNWAQF
jgi:hypothetical protein